MATRVTRLAGRMLTLLALLIPLAVGNLHPPPIRIALDARTETTLAPRTLATAHTTSSPRLDALATKLAQRPVTVLCYEHSEPLSPWSVGAWGYVYLDSPVEHMDADVCAGALALLEHKPYPLWKIANAALVFAHESFHLNELYPDRGDEARTECRAIRATGHTIRLLGGDADAVGTLMPYALAIHWRIGVIAAEYASPGCAVPWWWK